MIDEEKARQFAQDTITLDDVALGELESSRRGGSSRGELPASAATA